MRVWKKVPNVACLASDDGKIRHLYSPNKKIADEFERPQYYDQGHCYKIVKIYGRSHYVHRLVAAAFHGPCPKGLVVDHIDENRLNNHANNLRYITSCENVSRTCLNISLPKKLNDQQIKKLKEMIKFRRSLKLRKQDIAKMFNISDTTMRKYCK